MIAQIIAALAFAFVSHMLLRRYIEYQKEKNFANQFGCLPPPRVYNKWPLGTDRIKQIWDADNDSRLMEFFLMHFRKWGNTLEQVLLTIRAFNTIDPMNLEVVLSSQDFGMGRRRQILYPLFGDGIFTQDGLDWKHSREFLRPYFSLRQYQDLEIFRPHVDKLISNIPSDGGMINLQSLFFQLTLDITISLLFAEAIDITDASNTLRGRAFTDAFNTAQRYLAQRYRLGDLYWIIGGKNFKSSCALVHDYIEGLLNRGYIRQQRDTRKIGHSYPDLRVKYEGDQVGLRCHMINILVAGRDTTACLLSWTFRLLVRHPYVLKKLRKTINQHIGNRSDICRKDLQEIEYLTLVLKETLRLYPPVPVNSRTALRTTMLPTGGGKDRRSPVMIPKGSAVAYSVYALHRRTDLYGGDADKFRPERWKDPQLGLFRDEKALRWGYLPFNGGPRTCLGSRPLTNFLKVDFALTEVAYTVVRILQQFPVIEMPVEDCEEITGKEQQTMTLVLASKQGCRVWLGLGNQ